MKCGRTDVKGDGSSDNYCFQSCRKSRPLDISFMRVRSVLWALPSQPSPSRSPRNSSLPSPCLSDNSEQRGGSCCGSRRKSRRPSPLYFDLFFYPFVSPSGSTAGEPAVETDHKAGLRSTLVIVTRSRPLLILFDLLLILSRVFLHIHSPQQNNGDRERDHIHREINEDQRVFR